MAPDIRIEIMVKMLNVAYIRMYTTNTIQRMIINAICVCDSFLRAIWDKCDHKDIKKAQFSHPHPLNESMSLNETDLFIYSQRMNLQRNINQLNKNQTCAE